MSLNDTLRGTLLVANLTAAGCQPMNTGTGIPDRVEVKNPEKRTNLFVLDETRYKAGKLLKCILAKEGATFKKGVKGEFSVTRQSYDSARIALERILEEMDDRVDMNSGHLKAEKNASFEAEEPGSEKFAYISPSVTGSEYTRHKVLRRYDSGERIILDSVRILELGVHGEEGGSLITYEDNGANGSLSKVCSRAAYSLTMDCHKPTSEDQYNFGLVLEETIVAHECQDETAPQARE